MKLPSLTCLTLCGLLCLVSLLEPIGAYDITAVRVETSDCNNCGMWNFGDLALEIRWEGQVSCTTDLDGDFDEGDDEILYNLEDFYCGYPYYEFNELAALEMSLIHYGTDGGAFDAVSIYLGDLSNGTNLGTPAYECDFGAVFLDGDVTLHSENCTVLETDPSYDYYDSTE